MEVSSVMEVPSNHPKSRLWCSIESSMHFSDPLFMKRPWNFGLNPPCWTEGGDTLVTTVTTSKLGQAPQGIISTRETHTLNGTHMIHQLYYINCNDIYILVWKRHPDHWLHTRNTSPFLHGKTWVTLQWSNMVCWKIHHWKIFRKPPWPHGISQPYLITRG